MASSGALTHIRNYASAGVLGAFAGIVTFPIMTRSLTVGEYGILGLITSSATLFIACGKLGMQHAVIRFYAQVKNANIGYSLGQMNSTVSMLFLLLAIFTSCLWVALGYTVLPLLSDFENISELFVIAAGIVFLRLLGSGFLNFLRAQQRSGVVGLASILAKYSYLAFILLFVLLGWISVGFALASMVFAEIISIGFAAKKYGPDFYFRFNEVSASLGKAMLIYGVPLMMMESLGLVMRLSDRYIIQYMLGENALGMYSASYNLTAYLDIILLTAMVQAIKPHYMQLWESDGIKPTQQFLSDGLRTYLIIGIPLVALFSAVGPHLMGFLASAKYDPGTVIIPFVAFSFLIEGSIQFLAAGLYVRKNTSVLMFWGVIACCMNLTLNILAIPKFGILGPAIVTIITYALFILCVSLRAFKDLSFTIEPKVPAIIALLSITVFTMLYNLDFGGDFINLVVKGTIGLILLVAGIVIIDARSREIFLHRLRPPKPGMIK